MNIDLHSDELYEQNRLLSAEVERLRSELAASQAAQTLVKQQARWLQGLLQFATGPVIATDSAGRIALFNEAARSLLEFSDHAVLGLSLEQAPLQRRFRSALFDALNQAGDFARFDFALGNDQRHLAMVVRLRGESKEDCGRLIVLHDARAERGTDEARLAYMQTVAHDLRNPLGVALSSLVMLNELASGKEDEMVAEVFEIATQAVERMHDLLDDMVILETIVCRAGFKPVRTRVEGILQTVHRQMEDLFASRTQTCELAIEGPLPEVDASLEWLSRAVNGYASNAQKYGLEGGHIVIAARQQDDELLIEVRDDGPGIPPEALQHLFERFYRVPSIRRASTGSGLGLAIVKAVAEAHGGRVYVQSEPGVGSTFGLALPLSKS